MTVVNRFSLYRFLLLPLFLFGGYCHSAVLQYSVSGVEGEALDNIQAWLGNPPETAQARSNFLFTAEERVDSALRALGYYNAYIQLEITREEPEWRLKVVVEAGEQVRIRSVDVQIDGEAVQDQAFARLLADIPLRVGDPLHHGDFDAFRRRIQSLGLSRGYFSGEISRSIAAVEPRGRTADIELHYASGERYQFGAVSFDEEVIDGELLEPLLMFEPGDPYDQAKLQESQAQLQRTGYFATVILRPDLDMTRDLSVPLELSVYPAKRHNFDLGVGFSTDTRERLSATWRTPKLNRHGHSQETRIQYSSINPSGRFTYMIPMSHPLNDVLQLGARWEDNEFGDIDSDQRELSVRREKKKDEWVYSYHLRGLNEAWSIEDFRRENDYLLPGFWLSRRDRTGSAVNPDAGFSQLYRMEVASEHAGSDVDLVRVGANFNHIKSLGERHRLVSRLEIGAVFISDEDRADLAPSLNFFAGGSQSIRGFSYQSVGNEVTFIDEEGVERTLVVGGERLLVGSVEYQYRLNENWRGAVFVDGGDAFDEGDFDWNYGAGFGVHYLTQIGAVRLELANPITKDDPSWRFHLAIGAEF
jgi:translocation and assembly module TamA